jgi:glutamine amidotransferase
MNVALIDHGVGNLRSVEKALTAVGGDVVLTADPKRIQMADKVVLPGVGAFADAMRGLEERGLRRPVLAAIEEHKPLLGICVGMQMLFEVSEEHGEHEGLGVLPGRVVRFQSESLTIPQTGWNQIRPVRESPLIKGLPENSYAYFNHTYYCVPENPDHVLATTQYGLFYASMVQRGSLYGVQFHPEKSQQVGLAILGNFIHAC